MTVLLPSESFYAIRRRAWAFVKLLTALLPSWLRVPSPEDVRKVRSLQHDLVGVRRLRLRPEFREQAPVLRDEVSAELRGRFERLDSPGRFLADLDNLRGNLLGVHDLPQLLQQLAVALRLPRARDLRSAVLLLVDLVHAHDLRRALRAFALRSLLGAVLRPGVLRRVCSRLVRRVCALRAVRPLREPREFSLDLRTDDEQQLLQVAQEPDAQLGSRLVLRECADRPHQPDLPLALSDVAQVHPDGGAFRAVAPGAALRAFQDAVLREPVVRLQLRAELRLRPVQPAQERDRSELLRASRRAARQLAREPADDERVELQQRSVALLDLVDSEFVRAPLLRLARERARESDARRVADALESSEARSETLLQPVLEKRAQINAVDAELLALILAARPLLVLLRSELGLEYPKDLYRIAPIRKKCDIL